MNACWAVKSILRRAEWNGGFRPDSGLSTRDPRRPALRPTEASKAAVCYVRNTSICDVPLVTSNVRFGGK
jgi:hypothetical protein